MPLPLGPLAGFALGVLLALFAPGPAISGPAHPRPTLLVGLFAALVFAPVCAYFLAFAGDWSLAYLADSRSIPSALLLLLVVLDAASVVFGFSIGRRSTGRRRTRTVAALIALPLGAALIFIVVLFGRLRIDGTYHQVRGDFGTQPVAGGPLGYALVWMLGLLAAGFALTLRLFHERPRIPDTPAPKPPSALKKRPSEEPARFPRRPGIALPPRR
ncbi:MAG: hypothetical protein HUU21_20520 [Polyangiaceae bacterium]|nr:hypothetical protein [Polyangiaceae bacterium]